MTAQVDISPDAVERMTAFLERWYQHRPDEGFRIVIAMLNALSSSATASEKRVTELSAALKECDKMAEAGICQFGAGGKHEFLKDVRKAVHSTGLQGGLTEYRR